ncbi:MAG TPA: hypothetical protein VG735_07040, partial [Caulobacterales bacterium]|nr:hypothetical protein [Caulobacterales bacterium]
LVAIGAISCAFATALVVFPRIGDLLAGGLRGTLRDAFAWVLVVLSAAVMLCGGFLQASKYIGRESLRCDTVEGLVTDCWGPVSCFLGREIAIARR